MYKYQILCGSSLLASIVLYACKKEGGMNSQNFQPAVCDGSTPTYNSYVKGVMDSHCISCHGPGSNDGDFSTYSKLANSVNDGTFERSVLTQRTMPTSGPLPQATLNKLKCWLNNGHPEN